MTFEEYWQDKFVDASDRSQWEAVARAAWTASQAAERKRFLWMIGKLKKVCTSELGSVISSDYHQGWQEALAETKACVDSKVPDKLSLAAFVKFLRMILGPESEAP